MARIRRPRLSEEQTELRKHIWEIADPALRRDAISLAKAQEKLFAEMDLHKDNELDDRALEIIANRSRNEGEGDFRKKAAELYAYYFLINNGRSIWEGRAAKIEERFLEALEAG